MRTTEQIEKSQRFMDDARDLIMKMLFCVIIVLLLGMAFQGFKEFGITSISFLVAWIIMTVLTLFYMMRIFRLMLKWGRYRKSIEEEDR